MGTFRREIEIGDYEGHNFIEVEALVDTAATYTSMPEDILARHNVQPGEKREFILAHGERVSFGMTWIRIRLDGREQPTPVIFGSRGSEPLLGAVTLEEFGLAVDPVNRRLFPVPGYLVGIIELP